MSRKEPKYIIQYKKELRVKSNSEIFEELLSVAAGDYYDGGFTTRGINYLNAAIEVFEEKLPKDWMNK